MASIRKDIPLEAPAGDVWDVVRDVGAVHTRFAPGFVTDTKLDGDARIVTFANGLVVREVFVDLDEEARRFVYSVKGENLTHHNASFQVIPEGEARCRLVWRADLLPHEAAVQIGAMMEAGSLVAKRTLDRKRA